MNAIFTVQNVHTIEKIANFLYGCIPRQSPDPNYARAVIVIIAIIVKIAIALCVIAFIIEWFDLSITWNINNIYSMIIATQQKKHTQIRLLLFTYGNLANVHVLTHLHRRLSKSIDEHPIKCKLIPIESCFFRCPVIYWFYAYKTIALS